MSIHEVRKYLPHRYPFLLIDRVIDCEPGKSLTALKNVTINEPFFPGHFPNYPVMPGVLILEAMAQATGILSFKTADTLPDENSLYLFVGIDNARFRRQIEPGDQVTLKVQLVSHRRNMWKFSGEAWVGDKMACSADLMGIIQDVNK